MKKLLIVLLVVIGLGFLAGSAYARTSGTHWEWSEWGECLADGPQCGTDNGTQSRTGTCVAGGESKTCSLGTWVEPVYSCPVIHWHYLTHNVDVQYEKSADPTKCHRPSDNDLRDDYGMAGHVERGFFKAANSEWKDAILESEGYFENPETTSEQQACNTGVIDYSACEPEGQCPTACGYEGGEVPDGKGGYMKCEATESCSTRRWCFPDEESPTGYIAKAIPSDETPEVGKPWDSDGMIDKYCAYEDKPEPEPEPKDEPKENTFHKDTRCLDTTPDAPQWFVGEDGSAANNWHPLLTWSAMGGDEVEIKFSEDPNDLRWRFVTENDGHEIIGYMENTGLLGMIDYYYSMRVINGCKEGPWSPVISVFN